MSTASATLSGGLSRPGARRPSFAAKLALSAAAGAAAPPLLLFAAGAGSTPDGALALSVAAAGAAAGGALSCWLVRRLAAPVMRAADTLERYLQAGEIPADEDETASVGDEAERLLRDCARTARHCAGLRQALAQRAHTDPLTGLPDRRAAVDRLVAQVYKAERASLPVRFCAAVVMVDGLKGVNDTFGHDSGDAVLRAAARHLQQGLGGYLGTATADGESPTLAATDSWVARWCGAQFLVVLRGGPEQAQDLIEGLRRTLPEVYQVGGAVAIRCTLSAGAAAYRAGDTPGQLIRSAEAALEDAKREGQNSFRVAAGGRRRLALTSGVQYRSETTAALPFD